MMFNSNEPNNLLCSLLGTHKVQQKIPLWFMRQAGRYLPEYQAAMQGKTDFLQACYDVTLVENITLQPLNRFDLDAAIIFSDIMTLPDALGFHVEFPRGQQPKVFYEKRKKHSHANSLEILSPVLDSLKNVRKKLGREKALIGFVGAPWTLATYILGKEKNTKELINLHRQGDTTLKTLIEELTDFTPLFLAAQADAGADVLQIFDSNAGGLPHDIFMDFVLSPTQKITSALKKTNPKTYTIGFPKGAGTLYNLYATQAGVTATSIDYSVDPAWIRDNIFSIVQGNLDPTVLAYNAELAVAQTKKILEQLAHKPLIFNLGHGILPNTPTRNVELIIETVRQHTS